LLVRHDLARHQDDQAPSHGAEIGPAITCGIADGVQHVVDQLLRGRISAPGADLQALYAGQDRAGASFGLDEDADDRRRVRRA